MRTRWPALPVEALALVTVVVREARHVGAAVRASVRRAVTGATGRGRGQVAAVEGARGAPRGARRLRIVGVADDAVSRSHHGQGVVHPLAVVVVGERALGRRRGRRAQVAVDARARLHREVRVQEAGSPLRRCRCARGVCERKPVTPVALLERHLRRAVLHLCHVGQRGVRHQREVTDGAVFELGSRGQLRVERAITPRASGRLMTDRAVELGDAAHHHATDVDRRDELCVVVHRLKVVLLHDARGPHVRVAIGAAVGRLREARHARVGSAAVGGERGVEQASGERGDGGRARRAGVAVPAGRRVAG
jgi:hypothetical protein